MIIWKKKNRVVLALAALLLAGITGSAALPVNAAPKETKLPCKELFHDVQGTLVVKNLKTDRVYVCNPERSQQRFTP